MSSTQNETLTTLDPTFHSHTVFFLVGMCLPSPPVSYREILPSCGLTLFCPFCRPGHFKNHQFPFRILALPIPFLSTDTPVPETHTGPPPASLTPSGHRHAGVPSQSECSPHRPPSLGKQANGGGSRRAGKVHGASGCTTPPESSPLSPRPRQIGTRSRREGHRGIPHSPTGAVRAVLILLCFRIAWDLLGEVVSDRSDPPQQQMLSPSLDPHLARWWARVWAALPYYEDDLSLDGSPPCPKALKVNHRVGPLAERARWPLRECHATSVLLDGTDQPHMSPASGRDIKHLEIRDDLSPSYNTSLRRGTSSLFYRREK